MNIRKVFLALACILSGVSTFVPLYTLKLNGETVDGGNATIMPSFYGIVILVSAVLIIGFMFVGLKKGYVITSLINVGASIYAAIYASINKESAAAIVGITTKFAQALGTTGKYDYSIDEGPGFFMIIFSAILVLVLMLWNAFNNEEGY